MEVLRSEICRREKIIQDKLCKFKGSNVQKGFLEGGLHEIQDLKEIYFKIQNLQMIEENENCDMKKHKVDIPSGYEVESVSPCTKDAGLNMISTTVVFQKIKKELPKTWEEYLKTTNVPCLSKFYFRTEKKDVLKDVPVWLEDEHINEKYRALGKLELLRDVYNDGYKYPFINPVSIRRCNDEIIRSESDMGPLVLHRDIAKEFFMNFAQLIETAKPLL